MPVIVCPSISVEAGPVRIQTFGKAAGILTTHQSLAKRYVEPGVSFVGIGSDVSLLSGATTTLIENFSNSASAAAGPSNAGQVY